MHLPVQQRDEGENNKKGEKGGGRERTKRDGEAGEAAKEAEAEGKERRNRREKKEGRREREQEKIGDVSINGFHKMVLFLVVQSFFWIRANILAPIALP